MQRKSTAEDICPGARTRDRVGDWGSMLILRDAGFGKTRFEQFQASLGIASNTLTKRLAALVDAGLLERRRYCEHPPREDYILTDRGRDFAPVLDALKAFGDRHYPKPKRRPSA